MAAAWTGRALDVKKQRQPVELQWNQALQFGEYVVVATGSRERQGGNAAGGLDDLAAAQRRDSARRRRSDKATSREGDQPLAFRPCGIPPMTRLIWLAGRATT